MCDRTLSRLSLVFLRGAISFLMAALTVSHGQTASPQTQTALAERSTRTPPRWWQEIDTGPFISDTILTEKGGNVVALKAIAIKVGEKEEASMVFDTELLAWRAGFDGRVLLEGTPWSGSHGGNTSFPVTDESFYFQYFAGLGVAYRGDWNDPREIAAGPLSRPHGRYRGLYRYGRQVVLSYSVGDVGVLEMPALEKIRGGGQALTRTLQLDRAPTSTLEWAVAGVIDRRGKTGARPQLVDASAGASLHTREDGVVVLRLQPGFGATRLKLAYTDQSLTAGSLPPATDLTPLTRGGPGIFPQTFAVKGQLDRSTAGKAYAVDLIPLPAENPWKSPTRFGGFDFFDGGKRIAASTWNGDVWTADGVDEDLGQVTWRRFASGLYQTLGLKIVGNVVYTQGRDQITRLHDLNGDGEADYYECFNNDVLITPGFHEFSFDLETDREGNFYFSKAMPVLAGGRGFSAWTPHNGTVLKVSKDGSKLEVVAWGLRAPGGVGVSPDGVITTGENEGTYVPACKITWTPPGKLTFNGVVPSRWEGNRFIEPLPGAPTDYDRPLCWLPYSVDNSSGSQVWVPETTTWDPRHAGEMIHLSYGKSNLLRVMREEVDGVVQGGVYRLPIDIGAAVMRARFHPVNGQLYLIGFRGWQTNGRDAFQRVRYLGEGAPLPTEINVHRNGLLVRFSGALDRASAEDPSRYSISKWNYIWGPQYGSGRFSIDKPDLEAEAQALVETSKGAHTLIDSVPVSAARLLDDGKSVFLYIPKMTLAMQMEVKLDLADLMGRAVRESIYHTVHVMRDPYQIAGLRWEDIAVKETAPSGEPGLAMSFDSSTTDTVRVDQLALYVPSGMSPSVFLPAAPFGVSWQGTLVVPERDDYVFSVEGAGSFTLRINEQEIISGGLPAAAKAMTLSKGAHRIFASYRSPQTKDGGGHIRLMWSSTQFRSEPVPAVAFRHLPSAEIGLWEKVRAGREVFAEAHCVKCHQPQGGLPLSPEFKTVAPNFTDLSSRLDPNWIERWVTQPRGHCPTIPGTPTADILAYLREQGTGKAEESQKIISSDEGSRSAGEALVEKLHLKTWLESMSREHKHTDEGLLTFLQYPTRHDADTRFPDVRLSEQEAAQIAAYVRSKQPKAHETRQSSRAGEVALGKAAVARSCLVCHDPTTSSASTAPSLETIARTDWTVRGCVSENRGGAPDLRLDATQVDLLVTLRNADRDVGIHSWRRFAPAEYATNQVKALACATCHTTGGESKISDITYAGEKLTQTWLTALIAGQHSEKTRPWLEARMPGFPSRSSLLALGLAARAGAAPEPERNATRLLVTSHEVAVHGAKLSGAEGYACIACHDAGPQKALQVFEGQGPNLKAAAQRLRYDYYQRWMHFPQRVAPATIMPRYTKDRDHALLGDGEEGNAEAQFHAIWAWMNGLGNSSTY